jgi:hypothetical protein
LPRRRRAIFRPTIVSKTPEEKRSRVGQGHGSRPAACGQFLLKLVGDKCGNYHPRCVLDENAFPRANESDRKLSLQLLEGSFKLIYKDSETKEAAD